MFKRIASSPATYFLGFAAIGIFMFNSRGIFASAWHIWNDNAALEAKIREMEEKSAKLDAEIHYARSPGFMEREGKSRLNLKRPGEEVVVIVPDKESVSTSTITEGGWWQRLLSFVGFE